MGRAPASHGAPTGLTLRAELDGLGQRIAYTSWSPDGDSLVVAAGRKVTVWANGRAPRLTQLWEAPSDIALAVWSPRNDALALSDQRGSVWVYASGSAKRLRSDDQRCLCLAWSPSGDALHGLFLANDSTGERIGIWTWKPGDRAPRVLSRVIHASKAYSALSPDRKLMALAFPNGSLELWDLPTLTLLAELPAGHLPVYSLSLAPDGRQIALGGDHGTIEIWDLASRRRRRILPDHAQPVYSLAFSHDGDLLVSKGRDSKIRFWDCSTWNALAALDEHGFGHHEFELAFHPRTLRLASAGKRNTRIRVWDIDKPRLQRRQLWDGPMITILFLSANPSDQENLALGRELRTLRERLKLSGLRDRLELVALPAVRVEDMSELLIEHRPRIVHFAGHGLERGQLVVEDGDGKSHPITTRALESLFRLQAQTTECIVLNACYSEIQATAIARHIDYVIGMKSTIGDLDAIAFTLGFYQAIGGGEPIPRAFEYAKTQIALKNLPGDLVPVLLERDRRAELEPT